MIMEIKERKVMIVMDGSVYVEFVFDCKWLMDIFLKSLSLDNGLIYVGC